MQPLSLLFIAVGLSMDAFAVSVNDGVTARRAPAKRPLILALCFGIFQSLMAFVGWSLGAWASPLVSAMDHWIAFLLLLAVGVNMLRESFKADRKPIENSLTICTLLALSVATSIDALAVGVGFACLRSTIFDPVVIIGVTTFVLSLVGVYLGRVMGKLAGNRFELIGAAILLVIGFKILLEHELR